MTIYLEMRAVGRSYYDVIHDGEIICRSREPLLAGCRKLLELGHSAGSIVEIRREGQVGYSLRSRVGFAAKLTVDESSGAVFGRWKASPYSAVASPVRFSGSPLPDQPRKSKIAPRRHAATKPRIGSRPAVSIIGDGDRGYSVIDRTAQVLLRIERDGVHPAMWRVRRVGGEVLTDMVNLTRAQDAALSLVGAR